MAEEQDSSQAEEVSETRAHTPVVPEVSRVPKSVTSASNDEDCSLTQFMPLPEPKGQKRKRVDLPPHHVEVYSKPRKRLNIY